MTVMRSCISSLVTLGAIFSLVGQCSGRCEPSPAFLPPHLTKDELDLTGALKEIRAGLETLVSDPIYNSSSYSIEITSSKETLWTSYHTAVDRDQNRPGAKQVKGDSVYRIASVSKTFTTLAILQLHEAGKLNLDDPIDKHVPELKESEGGIHWNDITLRTLASQLSGIPREFAQSDLINDLTDPVANGLPPVDAHTLLQCDEYTNNEVPCTHKDLIESLKKKSPLFAPKQKSTYSNVNFELLGLAIESASGIRYETYMEDNIFSPIGLTSTSLNKPDDDVAVLPKQDNSWDFDRGIQNASGGVFSSSTDLSTFIRFILKNYNRLVAQVNWVNPQSFAYGMNTYYGMPWEMYRTDRILPNTQRPVTFVTKGGSHPGYYSLIAILPEYGLGFTILTAGNSNFQRNIREIITAPLIKAVEEAAQRQLAAQYAGTYTAAIETGLNTSITLSHNLSKGLYISKFISNGTNMFGDISNYLSGWFDSKTSRLQVIPTLLYRDEKNKKGELWRMVKVPETPSPYETWGAYCMTDDDPMLYGGRPFTEFVFWQNAEGHISGLDLTGFRVSLSRENIRSKLTSEPNVVDWQNQHPMLSE